MLSRVDRHLEIHLYDSAEENLHLRYQSGVKKVDLYSTPAYYKGDGSEFDVVIDDSYVPSKGAPVTQWKSKVYSRKELRLVPGENTWSMCFHPEEGRVFESPRELLQPRFSTCYCHHCRLFSAFAEDIEMFKEFRAYGHMVEPLSCENYPQYADLALLSSMFHKMSCGIAIPVLTNAEERAVDTISSFYPIVKISSGEVRSSPAFERKQIKLELPLPLVQVQAPSYPEFEGKLVGFYGVPPTILGSTQIQVPSRTSYQTGVTDISFISGVENIILALKSRVIYAPTGVVVPGYIKGKRKFQGYVDWEKKFEVSSDVGPAEFFSQKVELEGLQVEDYLLPAESVVKGQNVLNKYPITVRFRGLLSASPSTFLGRIRSWLFSLESRLLYRDFLKRSNALFSLERKKFDEVMQWLIGEKYVVKDGEWITLVFLI
jgi:hypothetical protein